MWLYTPATIRLASQAGEKLASGVCITNEKDEFLLSICPQLLAKKQPESQLAAGVASSVGDSAIEWEDIQVVASVDLPGTSKFLASLGDQFGLYPSDKLQVTVFQFDSADKERHKKRAREFACITESFQLTHRSVRIESSPFADVNAALFMGYLSDGSVSYIASDEPNKAQAVLVHARYMDGMEGGVVSLEMANRRMGPTIGLVAGSLRKTSGEGSLTLVVPWAEIISGVLGQNIHAALETCLTEASKAGNGPRPFREVSNKYPQVVVVQSLLKGGRKVWGSGVIVDKDIVATNKHVIKDNLGLTVWLEKYNSRKVLAVAEPLQGVDLVFLRLSKHLPGKYKPVALAEKPVAAGTQVYSVGYGLFYPQRLGLALQPLYSAGLISGQVNLANKESMLVSTAGCWNGSSGGGLFNQSHELLGIMASNARDESTGEIMPEMAFVIPASIVKHGLELTGGSEVSQVSEQFQKLWKLQKTHHDSRKRLTSKL